jgi:hypothetical protein
MCKILSCDRDPKALLRPRCKAVKDDNVVRATQRCIRLRQRGVQLLQKAAYRLAAECFNFHHIAPLVVWPRSRFYGHD